MALYSPLSEIMREFYPLVFLALFSGLYPCAEPLTVSDQEKGKKEPGPSGMRSPVKLGTAAWLRAVTAAKCCSYSSWVESVLKNAQCMKDKELIIVIALHCFLVRWRLEVCVFIVCTVQGVKMLHYNASQVMNHK